ncbi:MAG: hypothetical protein FJ011_18935 [Chloroflexi bacterium]|nr:hypothetical protein [Chloroflexota bacterium]
MKNTIDMLTDERDGNTYRTMVIGDQCWMAENLRYLPSVSPISARSPRRLWRHVQNNSRIRPYYYVYGYPGRRVSEAQATANYRHYGVLYNWPAAMGACPPGWHLPGDEEWTQLVDYLMQAYGLHNDWVHTHCAGNALKSRRQIDSPLNNAGNPAEHPRWDSIHTPPPERKTVAVNVGQQYGTDEVGFSALPGGRYAYGAFTELGFIGFWWTSTECYATRAWYRFMRHEFGDVTRSSFDKAAGLSVRCVRD